VHHHVVVGVPAAGVAQDHRAPAEVELHGALDRAVGQRRVGGGDRRGGGGVGAAAVVGAPLGALGGGGRGERGAAARVGEHRTREERGRAEAVVEMRVGEHDDEGERGDGADGGGELGALSRVAAGVDDERALPAEHQAGGEVELGVPPGEHRVADLDPPPLGARRHAAHRAGPPRPRRESAHHCGSRALVVGGGLVELGAVQLRVPAAAC
jgi:hypothetical protein